MRRQLLALFVVFLAAADISSTVPHFSYTRAAKLLLNWDDVWEVGDSRSIAVLKAGSRITMWIRVTGDTGVGMRRILSFKCPRATRRDIIDLDSISVGSAGVARCPDYLPFVISKTEVSINKFVLEIGESKLAVSEVFKEALEMHVRIEFLTGRLTSQPLRIWSLDSISPPASALSNAETVNYGPLTAEAVNFATRIGSYSDSFTSVDFLNPALVAALAEAPAFFQSKVNFGMILYFDASSCVTYQLSSTILLTNYHSKMDAEHRNFGKFAYLNLNDGKLWYSTCGLSRGVKNFYDEEKPTISIGICTIISLTGDAEPYVKTGPVRPRILINELSYQGCNITTLSQRCEVVPNVKANVDVISGMDNTAIVCPIICNDMNESYRFFKDGKLLIGTSSSEWSLVEGIRVSKTGNIIEFPPSVSAAHSGTYRCEAGTKKFSYHVRVVSLPHFIVQRLSPSGYGLLPEKVFAMEGESLSYSCTVSFASLSSVKVTPAFYMSLTVGDKLNWVRLNDAEFRQKVDATNEYLTLTTISGNNTQTLIVSVARVPSPNPSLLTNFTHRFECAASVNSSESQLVGISEFSVPSARSNVVFIPRFRADSFEINPYNNCSVQHCLLSTGAFFEFRLSNKIMDQLNGMGVELMAYLKLDSVPLSSMAVLHRDNASTLEVDSANGRLSFRIHPVNSREVMSELLRGRSLTAVFNLRYKSGIDLGSLQIRKDAYGGPSPALGHLDCRADPFCFYSTDFDLDSLGFLSVPLKFQQSPEPPSQLAGASAYVASAIIVAILLIVALGIVVYLVNTRQTEHIYAVEEIEVKQGYNPQQEARAEVFGEYQRPSHMEGVWQPTSPGDQLSLISGLSETSEEPTHLEDDIDYREYGEEGSFIGNYQTDTKRRELPDTSEDVNGVGANSLHF